MEQFQDRIKILQENEVISQKDTVTDEVDFIEETISDKSKLLATKQGKEMFNNLLRKYISTGMFILIPLTALIFFLIFHKRTYYFEHLIFSFHLQSVIFLIFTLNNMIEWFIDSDIIDGGISILRA